jgi:hypothetical protein
MKPRNLLSDEFCKSVPPSLHWAVSDPVIHKASKGSFPAGFPPALAKEVAGPQALPANRPRRRSHTVHGCD